MLNGRNILCTGGTGSFGRHFVRRILADYHPNKVIVFSRDELKQSQMEAEFDAPNLRFFLGDIRDKDRLKRVFGQVDYVVHAAALKQVPALEYNPTEAVKTNIDGAMNIVEAAIDTKVEKVIALSSDKAVNPINLYGATKLVMEKLFTAANAYAGHHTIFSCVRYGNVIGSRGSVIPLFQRLKDEGIKEFPVTDKEMTRFWLTLDESVDLVLFALQKSIGGEIFVPKIPSMKIVDIAHTIDPECSIKEIGIRAGEKLHEKLISEDEKNIYLVENSSCIQATEEYNSRDNDSWLTKKQMRRILK